MKRTIKRLCYSVHLWRWSSVLYEYVVVVTFILVALAKDKRVQFTLSVIIITGCAVWRTEQWSPGDHLIFSCEKPPWQNLPAHHRSSLYLLAALQLRHHRETKGCQALPCQSSCQHGPAGSPYCKVTFTENSILKNTQSEPNLRT